MIILAVIIAAALVAFYAILQANIPIAWKVGLAIAEMIVLNQIFIKIYKAPNEIGLVLLKSKKGIEMIESLARRQKAFEFMADIGSSMSYGLLSIPLMRKNVSPASFIIGMVLLAIATLLVAPISLTFLLGVIRTGSLTTYPSVVPSSIPDIWSIGLIAAILIIGGLFLFILSNIVLYGFIIFEALVKSVFFGTNEIARTAAGGTLLLPGVNLPLVEGIVALAIVMAVHEGSHAILARIAKVKILSSGIVLFGIIPIGAFVEPDEQALAKVEAKKQTRVLVAGPTANLITSIIIFVLFIAFFFSTSAYREQGYLVHSGMAGGTVIFAINGTPVNLQNYTNSTLPANTSILLSTNYGNITRMTDQNGKLGITITPVFRDSIIGVYDNPILGFIYMVMGLSMALNFVVGTVNILPIPLFDGYRIVDVNISNKTIVKVLSYTALLFFIINFLPLLFH